MYFRGSKSFALPLRNPSARLENEADTRQDQKGKHKVQLTQV